MMLLYETIVNTSCHESKRKVKFIKRIKSEAKERFKMINYQHSVDNLPTGILEIFHDT